MLQLFFGGNFGQAQLGAKVNRFSGCCCHLKTVILCHKSNVLPNFNFGWVYNVVIKPNVRCDFDAAIGTCSSCKNIQEGCFACSSRLVGEAGDQHNKKHELLFVHPFLSAMQDSCEDYTTLTGSAWAHDRSGLTFWHLSPDCIQKCSVWFTVGTSLYH